MGMTHYMELMMGSWYLLVLFMAVPMFLAECYVVSEILLLLKPREGGALVAFNKLSAFASAAGIALLSAYAAFYFSRVTEWRTWIDVTAAVAYVAAGLPFLYVGLLEAGLIARKKAGDDSVTWVEPKVFKKLAAQAEAEAKAAEGDANV